MIELRVLALVGLLVVMIGTTLTFMAVVALVERLRPVWPLNRSFDADRSDGDSPRRKRIRAILTGIRSIGGEIP